MRKIMISLICIALVLLMALAGLRYYGKKYLKVDVNMYLTQQNYVSPNEFQMGNYLLIERGKNFDYLTKMLVDSLGEPCTPSFCNWDVYGEIQGMIARMDNKAVIILKDKGLYKTIYDEGDAENFSISSDGSQFAFAVDLTKITVKNPEDSSDVGIFDIQNRSFTKLGLAGLVPHAYISWMDNENILVSIREQKIATVNIIDKVVEILPITGDYPYYVDGKIYYYKKFSHIYVPKEVFCYDLKSQTEEFVLENRFLSGQVTVSPDGKYLACQSTMQLKEPLFTPYLFEGSSLFIYDIERKISTYLTNQEYYDRYLFWIDKNLEAKPQGQPVVFE